MLPKQNLKRAAWRRNSTSGSNFDKFHLSGKMHSGLAIDFLISVLTLIWFAVFKWVEGKSCFRVGNGDL